MSRFLIKLAIILFKEYKNKLTNQEMPKIKIYNYLLIQSYLEKEQHFVVHMRYTGIFMKRPQFYIKSIYWYYQFNRDPD